MFRTKDEILRGLNPHNPASIQALIDFHRQTLGGFVMQADAEDQPAGDPPAGDPPAGDGKAKDDKAKDEGEKPLGPNGEKALQAERDARQRIETELKEFKAAQSEQARKLADAFGIKPENGETSEDVVAALQKQVQDMQRDNLVFRVVTDPEHPIIDADDLELIKASPDEATMRRLAARLAAKKVVDDDDDPKPVRRFPRPDPSQGRGHRGPDVTFEGSSARELLRSGYADSPSK